MKLPFVPFSMNTMLERKAGYAEKPSPAFYATPPQGFVKLFSWDAKSCGFFRISKNEFEDFKSFWPQWSSLPDGVKYICYGKYPIAQQFMIEGTQYTCSHTIVEWMINEGRLTW